MISRLMIQIACNLLLTAACLAQKGGPVIVQYDGQAAIFPASWQKAGTRAKATAANDSIFRLDSLVIDQAMGKYTNAILQQELKHVYVTGRIKFNGQYFTGTNSNEDVYIAVEANPDIEKTFHHEFSSILLRNHSDLELEMKWRSLSPGLRNGNSAAAVKAGIYATGIDTALCAKGYLSAYALSNWENDFNMYAENIFAGGKEFWAVVDRFPAVKQKAGLVIAFYHKIWPGYTEIFFRAAAGPQ